MNINRRELRKRRSRAKIFGTAVRPRLSVFRSHRYTYVQLIDDEKGHTLAAAKTAAGVFRARELGMAIAQEAKKLGVLQAVFNRSHYKYHGRVKAVAEGAREAGLKI